MMMFKAMANDSVYGKMEQLSTYYQEQMNRREVAGELVMDEDKTGWFIVKFKENASLYH